MSNNARRIRLTEWKQEQLEGGEIVVELLDGTEWKFPPAVLWPDVVDTRTAVGVIVAVVGQEEYERLIAGGGSARIIDHLLTEQQGATPGK